MKTSMQKLELALAVIEEMQATLLDMAREIREIARLDSKSERLRKVEPVQRDADDELEEAS